jgi:hypothetical protein
MLRFDRHDARRGLIAVRLLLGVLSWVAPGLLHDIMKIGRGTERATAYPLRLFGVRDAFSGAALVFTDGTERDRMLALNVAADLADVVASTMAGATGNLSRRGAVFCSVAGLIGASLGFAALGRGPLARPEKPGRR